MEKRPSIKSLAILGGSALTIALLLILTNLPTVMHAVSTLLSVAESLIFGAVFAFLLNPYVVFVDKRLCPALLRRGMKEKTARRLSRWTGLLFGFVVIALMIYTLVALVAPRIYESVVGIADNFPSYYETVEKWVIATLADNPQLGYTINMAMDQGYDMLRNFVTNDLMPQAQTMLLSLTTSIYSIVSTLFNMVLGLVVSIYIVISKDTFIAQSKKIVISIWKPSSANYIMETGRKIHKIFNGFIVGKLLDSLIIGILAYIGLALLNMPYAILLALIIGLTNIIPYFGPFIGAIPCTLLVLLVNPTQCLYFVIFVLVLQQIDGNFIGPKILGENVGVGSFWILVSITIGGGLFGFMGMLLGVPVFAVIYTIVSERVSSALAKKGQSTKTADYFPIAMVEDLPRQENEVEK